MIESRIAATSLRGDALHALAQVPAHAAGAEEADDGGGAEAHVPGVDRDAGPGHPHLRQHGVDEDLQLVGAGGADRLDLARPDRLDRLREQLAGEADAVERQRQRAGQHAEAEHHHQQDGPDHLVDRAAGHDDEARRLVEEAPARRHVVGREPGQRHRGGQADHGREVRHLQRLDHRVPVLGVEDVADVGREVAPRQHLAHPAEHARAGARDRCSGTRSRTPGRPASRAGRRTCRGSADSGSGSRSPASRWRRARPRRRGRGLGSTAGSAWVGEAAHAPAQMTARRA